MTESACPRSGLAKTAEHHRSIGSTPPQELVDNPGKTLLETMNEEELREYLRTSIETVRETYLEALAGDSRAIRFLEVMRDDFLIPDMEYLRGVGRLPIELEDFDPRIQFAL